MSVCAQSNDYKVFGHDAGSFHTYLQLWLWPARTIGRPFGAWPPQLQSAHHIKRLGFLDDAKRDLILDDRSICDIC
jgi:hypothetical protein